MQGPPRALRSKATKPVHDTVAKAGPQRATEDHADGVSGTGFQQFLKTIKSLGAMT